jgi:hypothetical protein
MWVASLSKKSIYESMAARIPPSAENFHMAREFVMERWIERSIERGAKVPTDLSSACKFASLFAWQIFGGKIAGNSRHQFVLMASGDVLDLCAGSAELESMPAPYVHDPSFFGNSEHLESLQSCLPRVSKWLQSFEEMMSEHQPLALPHRPCRQC